MPRYGWKKGRGVQVLEGDAPPLEKVDVSTRQAGTAAKGKKLSCDVCGDGKKFKIAVAFANHFRRAHPELVETKDSWRAHATYH